jgi:hypothetical protein
VIIRPENAADHNAIRKVNDEAFGEPIDAKIVDAIRGSDRYVPDLSLVAVSEGQTLGHVISSYVDVEPGARRVLQVGPLAVLPAHQRRVTAEFHTRPLASGADRGPADPLRSLRAWPGERVEREEEPCCAHCGTAFFSMSVPMHGRLPFSIGTPVPALEIRPLNGGREPDTPGVH